MRSFRYAFVLLSGLVPFAAGAAATWFYQESEATASLEVSFDEAIEEVAAFLHPALLYVDGADQLQVCVDDEWAEEGWRGETLVRVADTSLPPSVALPVTEFTGLLSAASAFRDSNPGAFDAAYRRGVTEVGKVDGTIDVDTPVVDVDGEIHVEW